MSERLLSPTPGQMRDMMEKAIQRGTKGVKFINARAAEVGLTPKELIYDEGTLKLFHYLPQADEIYRIPVIIVMATTNKGYLFDLIPGQSMVEYLLQEGFDVYMIDWDPPQKREKGLRLEDYTHRFIPRCIEEVQRESGEDDVNIIGYCQGGVLSLIYASTHTDGPLQNLVCLTTPINFEEMGLTRTLSSEDHMDVDKMVDTLGIIPADFIEAGFEILRPAQKTAGQMRVWDQMWNDDFVRSYRAFNRWSEETLPLAGEYFRDCTKQLNWANGLYNGTVRVGGDVADLSNIKIPLMAVMAEHDHIATYGATKALMELVGSEDKTDLVLKGGHVSIIAGPNAVRRMWPAVNEWLGERSV
ncbi:MAG: alpha/beta fold hydrolase [Chloroflexota bacterium]|nr:alpha/beta fold hydrolase [Chloroflexota bacterium]